MVHQNLSSLLGMEAENEKKPQQIVCSRTEDETGGLDLNERREGEELKFYWPTFTPGWLCQKAPRECLRELGTETKG